ncbi:Hsp70 protein-domain-containing protein [Aspergillus oleicola]
MAISIFSRRVTRRPRRRSWNTAALSCASLCFLLFLLFAAQAQADQPEPKSTAKEKLIGIHLGASESRVGVVQNGQVSVLRSGDGNCKTSIPSYVVATETGPVAGAAAQKHGGLNFFKAVLDMKSYFDQSTTHDTPPRPPHYVQSYTTKDEQQVLQIDFNETCHSLTAEEIYAPLLAELRDIAESHIGPGITGAVVATSLPYDGMANAELEGAGGRIGLPIVRHMRESTAMLLGLGLDELSYESERYVLLYDLSEDHQTLTISVIEIDMGVMDTLSVRRSKILAANIHDYEHDSQDLESEDGVPSHPQNQITTYPLPLIESYLEDFTPLFISTALINANLTHKNITDLLFTPPARHFPGIQSDILRWFDVFGNDHIKIANSEELKNAPVHGASLVAHWLSDDDETSNWVPCECNTYRPAIGIGTGDGVVEILEGCYPLPAHATQSFRGSCSGSNKGITTIQVYMRDVPPADYHALMELGDAYIPNTTISDILLGSFDIPTPCRSGKLPPSPLLDISVLMTRGSELKVEAVSKEAGTVRRLTFPQLGFDCGSDGRSAERNYTYNGRPAIPLREEYEMDLKRFVGVSKHERVVDASDQDILGRDV